MAGFFVADGAYCNTIAPNPRCCSDPGVLCRECAKLALASPSSKYFDWQGTTNCDAGQDDILPLPTLDDLLYGPGSNRKRPEPDAFIINDDPDLLIPPVIDWSAASRKRDADRQTERPVATTGTTDEDDVLPLPVMTW